MKLKDADLIGIPLRIVVSEKTMAKNSVEVKRRKEEGFELVEMDRLMNFAENFNIDKIN